MAVVFVFIKNRTKYADVTPLTVPTISGKTTNSQTEYNNQTKNIQVVRTASYGVLVREY